MVTHVDITNTLLGYFTSDHKGIFLEVGAAHPTMSSISYPFRAKEWNVISVEPNPEFIDNFNELGLPVLPYAACAEDKGTTTFKISPNSFSCSALEIKNNYKGYMDWTDESYRTIKVQAFKLDTILQQHHPELQHIDILLIDTEGWELEVLEGFDLKKFNPKVICLENFSSSNSYRVYLEKFGYRLDKKMEQDEFFVK